METGPRIEIKTSEGVPRGNTSADAEKSSMAWKLLGLRSQVNHLPNGPLVTGTISLFSLSVRWSTLRTSMMKQDTYLAMNVPIEVHDVVAGMDETNRADGEVEWRGVPWDPGDSGAKLNIQCQQTRSMPTVHKAPLSQ